MRGRGVICIIMNGFSYEKKGAIALSIVENTIR